MPPESDVPPIGVSAIDAPPSAVCGSRREIGGVPSPPTEDPR